MLLKSIKLENIRSFVKQELLFPEGTILLAGDIGTGKSTILQAVEFALFGFKPGELTGNSLLRNGQEQGAVELHFSLDTTPIHIKRILRRGTNGIRQEFGYLSIGGIGQEYTSTELKQRILTLLNYPTESLTKKSMIYRYTVYTPQEEMKLILSGNNEDRMETLRKIFNIDKYKRICENSKILTSKLREKRKELAGKIYDLELKKEHLTSKEKNISLLQNKITSSVQQLQESSLRTQHKKQLLQEEEKKIEKTNILRKNIAIQELALKNKTASHEKNMFEKDRILKDLQSYKDLKIETRNYQLELKRYLDLIKTTEENLKDINAKLQEHTTKKKTSQEMHQKISSLDNCPTCLQHVPHEHKHSILTREESFIQNYDEEIKKLLKEQTEIEFTLEKLKQEQEIVRQQEKQAEITTIRKQEMEKKQLLLQELEKEQEKIKQEFQEIQHTLNQLTKDIQELSSTEKNYLLIKEDYEKTAKEEQNFYLQKAVLEKEIYLEQQTIQNLTKEVQEKELAKTKIHNYTNIQNWIEDHFCTITELIERNIMQKVHQDFNELFQKWFKLLIEGDMLKVSLDTELSPKMEQNGYDIDYESLSGGEKTAAALAYRLALNQVINSLVQNIHTRDLLMLDEPTDGFSSEQIHKLRDVLQELHMKQVIIVSHEQEMETFVDSVLKLEKQEHISSLHLH